MFRRFFSAGRLNRRTFLAGYLIMRAVSFALITRVIDQTNFWVYLVLLSVFINFFSLSLSWRRLQDIGFLRRYIILIIVFDYIFSTVFLSNLLLFGLPLSLRFLSYGFTLYLLFAPGSPKANQYGPVPAPKIDWDKIFGDFSFNKT